MAPTPARWLDLGSGGGLPGLVLAQHWPDTPAVLLDASERRTAFLSEAVLELGWADRVHVVRARAEEAGSVHSGFRAGFDVVWARSFGSPPVTAECAAPFLKPGRPPGGIGAPPADGSLRYRHPVATGGVGPAGPGAPEERPGPIRIPGHPSGDGLPGALSPAVGSGHQAAAVPRVGGVAKPPHLDRTRVSPGQGTEIANVPRVTLR